MKARLRNESGQAVLLTVVFLTVLIGAAAITTDVGAWYRQQRAAQAAADAAALAGAQALPTDPATAQTLAQQYGASNGGGVKDISVSTGFEPNDTVNVSVERVAPSFFAKIFSIDSATVDAAASARAGVPNQVDGVAPIVVNEQECDLLGCAGCPCFNSTTTLPLGKGALLGAPGAFGLVDLNGGSNGNPALANWIQNGYDGYLGLGPYQSNTGAQFNSGPVQSALSARIGTELLFPVYEPPMSGGGANATYNVIGWVAFYLQSYDARGSSGSITGYFTRVIWNGIQSATNQHIPDFGVYSVELVK